MLVNDAQATSRIKSRCMVAVAVVVADGGVCRPSVSNSVLGLLLGRAHFDDDQIINEKTRFFCILKRTSSSVV